MIQINLKHAILIGSVVLAIALMSGKSNQTTQGQKEMMMVQQLAYKALVLYHPDKPAEKIDLESCYNMDKWMKSGEIINSKLQELFNQGWELAGTNGGDYSHTYVLTRQK